jgi:LCP family protein required for cell wall assembly
VSDQLRPRSNRAQPLTAIARHGRLKKSNPWGTAAKFLSGALAVLLVSGASVAAIAALDVAASVKPSVHLANEKALGDTVKQIASIEGGVNLLLIGSDSRAGQDPMFGGEDETGNLNDVTMLLHISQDHKNASVISFPRDMFVPIPECPLPDGDTSSAMSRQKINTTLSYGMACTVLTVEKLTGLSIPFAAEVQFSGVMAMSTAVGGVPVCVADRIEDEYTGIFLDPGMHELQGLEALQFLRTRHGIGDGSDLTRINNQQVFMSSLVRTIKSSDTLSDPLKVYSLAKAVTGNMTLSASLNDVGTIASIAMALKDIPLEDIVFVQVPTGGTEGGVVPSQPDFDDLFNAVAADQPLKLSGAMGRGATLDPSAVAPAVPADPAAPADAPVDAAAPTDAPGAVLSDRATGQTAGELTCSVGRTLDNQ